jgi:hypothetical protein
LQSTQIKDSLEYTPGLGQAALLGPRLSHFFTQWIAADQPTREMLTCIILVAPLTAGLPIQTLPITHLTGKSGEGKTQTGGLLTTFLHGSDGPKGLLDATTAAARRSAPANVFMAFDDYENIDDSMKTMILKSATAVTHLKSGAGLRGVDSAPMHTLLCITSVNPLGASQHMDGSTIRRRTLTFTIDNTRYPVPNYGDMQWRQLQEAREELWHHYWIWVAQRFLPRLQVTDFDVLSRSVAQLIEVSTFRGLAPFLSLLWLVAEQVRPEIPNFCLGDRDSVLRRWIATLQLNDAENIEDDDPVLNSLRIFYSQVVPGEVGEMVQLTIGDHVSEVTRVLQTTLRSNDMLLTVVPITKLPVLPKAGYKIIALQGTNLQWFETLRRSAGPAAREMTASKFRNWMERNTSLTGRYKKESDVITFLEFKIQKLGNAGRTHTDVGWRVMLEVPDEPRQVSPMLLTPTLPTMPAQSYQATDAEKDVS